MPNPAFKWWGFTYAKGNARRGFVNVNFIEFFILTLKYGYVNIVERSQKSGCPCTLKIKQRQTKWTLRFLQRSFNSNSYNELADIEKMSAKVMSWKAFLKIVRSGNSPDLIIQFFREFDPGSGRTLAACLTHASRTENHNWNWYKLAQGFFARDS